MKFLTRRILKFSQLPVCPEKSKKGSVYAIINLGCPLCWESIQELTKLANYCAGQDLELRLYTQPFDVQNLALYNPPVRISTQNLNRHVLDDDLPMIVSPVESYPCLSLVAAKILLQIENRPESHVLEFLNHALNQIHENSQDPYQLSFYHSTCNALGLNFEIFQNLICSSITKSILSREAQTSRNLGAVITPTVVWHNGTEIKTLAAGLLDYEIIRFRLRQVSTLN